MIHVVCMTCKQQKVSRGERPLSLPLTYDKALCHPQQLQLRWRGYCALNSESIREQSNLRALGWRHNENIKLKILRIQYDFNETQNHTCPKWPALPKSEHNLKWDLSQVECNCWSVHQHQASPSYLLRVVLSPTYSNFPCTHALAEKQARTAEVSKNLLLTCSLHSSMSFTAAYGQSCLTWDL